MTSPYTPEELDDTQPVIEPFERELSFDVVLWDVSHLMVRHATKRYAKRTQPIERIYVHHSGAFGVDGVAGAINSSRYDVMQTKDKFPGAAYHWWIPYKDLLDSKGRRVILRMNPNDVVCWSTGGSANRHGFGLCFQGNHGKDGEPLSSNQVVCGDVALRALLSIPTLDRKNPIAWHSIAQNFSTAEGKSTCPGHYTEEWLKRWLRSEDLPIPTGNT